MTFFLYSQRIMEMRRHCWRLEHWTRRLSVLGLILWLLTFDLLAQAQSDCTFAFPRLNRNKRRFFVFLRTNNSRKSKQFQEKCPHEVICFGARFPQSQIRAESAESFRVRGGGTAKSPLRPPTEGGKRREKTSHTPG